MTKKEPSRMGLMDFAADYRICAVMNLVKVCKLSISVAERNNENHVQKARQKGKIRKSPQHITHPHSICMYMYYRY